jgi:hypothetical protein
MSAVEPNADWQRRVDELWASFDDFGEDEFMARLDRLLSELPPDGALVAFERAGAFDATDHPDEAVPLYRQAIERGLDPSRRRQATIQLASTLRNVGEVGEAVSLLRAERSAGSDELDDAVSAFLALALCDAGQERQAVSLALGALARHLPMYRRSVANYAAELGARDGP